MTMRLQVKRLSDLDRLARGAERSASYGGLEFCLSLRLARRNAYFAACAM
jgi:hypothetical protein